MRTYRIGICDDERGTCAEIEDNVYRFFSEGNYSADIDVWYSGEDCKRSLNGENNYDIIFLDIELPGINGVDVGKSIREELKNDIVQIVYISSKTGYALDLFQVHPYDFLIKPITYEAMASILSKLLNLDENDSRIFRYKNGKTERKIPIGRIMYLESNNKHVLLYLDDGSIVEYPGKLSAEKEKLPRQFVTVAKSYIVNMKYIESCSSSCLQLINDRKINITAPHRAEFRLTFAQFLEGGAINE